MKNLSFLNVLMMAFAIFALSSCGSDDTEVLKPIVTFESGVDFISSDSDVVPGEDFTVSLKATVGDNPLNSLTIKQDGVNVDGSRIAIVGISTVNNPQLVSGADVDGFTWEITITAHTDESDSPYDFIVADSKNNTTTATLFINTVGAAVAPTVTIDGPTSFTASPSSAQIVKINATPGSSKLSTIAVYEDDVLITDLARLDYEGVAFDSNPYLLEGGDIDGLSSTEITVRVGTEGATYRFEVADEGTQSASAEVVINIGTLVTELTGQLLNQAGPVGQGGLDLDVDNGSVGSMNAAAEIKDEGIDLGQPNATNWKKQISAANNAVLKFANNLPDGSGYDDITTQEEIEGAFANADDLTGGVSAVVAIGDEFVVERDGVYYFLKVTDVNVTTADNADYYEFSIKK